MKVLLTIIPMLLFAVLISCDMRSDTAKKEMEKFSGSPTPRVSPAPAEAPIDPADIVQVDTSLDGDTISLNVPEDSKKANCTKFNRVMVNGDRNVFTIKGVCRQILVNGDGSQITADAAMEFVFNGSGNTVTYSHFPNGKRPIVTDNQSDNTVEKIAADAAAKTKDQHKK